MPELVDVAWIQFVLRHLVKVKRKAPVRTIGAFLTALICERVVGTSLAFHPALLLSSAFLLISFYSPLPSFQSSLWVRETIQSPVTCLYKNTTTQYVIAVSRPKYVRMLSAVCNGTCCPPALCTKPFTALQRSLCIFLTSVLSKPLASNQLDAIFHVFIYLFHLSTCFEH